MIGSLDPDERVLENKSLTVDEIVLALFDELGWEEGDDIQVKIAGARTSGIHQTDGANPKWSPPFGDVRYNRDAQIVIENLSRRDTTKSQPLQQSVLSEEFIHDSGGQLYKARKSPELPEPTRVVPARVRKRDKVVGWIRQALSRRG